jgi:hypothetical protein
MKQQQRSVSTTVCTLCVILLCLFVGFIWKEESLIESFISKSENSSSTSREGLQGEGDDDDDDSYDVSTIAIADEESASDDVKREKMNGESNEAQAQA